ncbi:putative Delta(7)-sterol 5(6)-desaturase [Colletotrichum siamense]|uniref:Delta(7)-sterol 5(6)-desaturase n=1 Tax=Colletotrichum siamense TaxID=690259 RepID=A0A9P5EE96_COLSI|nr:putative Delta(7)-sterol 5(6)-desaturase [Colletotrichum siamense]KAF4816915.1 putative Delta(7)-sterol 5(6)-desaturase [Colletotrichum tropicale]KAI8157481.1 putative Delta(7)-sterol 5(6)-desaturase [Colletotrichum sp. SAR 10_71]KAI8168565.1 putative Delta(7)-sterol 5(6)-desaturase [Colletotrichum sp. SAR 10_70]KAI8176047.1 putative Delta(7)-sterol 5(6)-desaturase [Colletotrichum sp. SAR 10_75]KAI8176327.1 putative Delta(7)-sterol 5(6)-desaturase [Colletotrichum sp. SAR 10_65]KAI8202263.1
MDIVLEVVDTFVGDKIYASLLPAGAAPYDFPHTAANATAQPLSTWQYKPATHWLHLEPSEAAYMSAWPRDNMYRQFTSLFLVTWIFGLLNYFVFATLSYIFIFDKKTFNHPKFLKNQVWLEMKQANKAMPIMSLCTAITFLAEVRGFCKLYDTTEEGPGRWYDWAQFPLFILFTDLCIYWIHRWLHLPSVYKHLHKPHHKWIMPSPYASHAFHPLDGFAQSVPYHVYPMLFPLQKMAYVALFMFINFWTILIHDGEYITDNPIINGSACHTAHHLYFNYNYGQFTTLWDRLGGSYRKPDLAWFNKQTKMSEETWKSGIKDMEKIQKEVEGDDDRQYGASVDQKKKN